MVQRKQNNHFSVSVPSQSVYLAVVRAAAAKACEIAGFPHEESGQIVLAVDEACTNIIKYAYRNDPNQTILLTFCVADRRLEVRIDDSGPKIRLEDLHGRSLDDVKPGGLGLHLIRRAFDVVALDGRKRQGNRLQLIRTLQEQE
jgi:anti-sigma regulatory factor (Ser/Thr protein kinase)